MRRVAISGVGLLTALGCGAQETWTALLEGRTAIGPVRRFDPTGLRSQLAAEIDGFDPSRFADRRALKLMTRNDQLAVAGALLAAADSGLSKDDLQTEMAAVFVGGNKETSNPDSVAEDAMAGRAADGSVDLQWLGRNASSKFHPLFYVEALQLASLYHISNALGPKGPNCYFAGTADAGATAIGRAYRAIRRGEADVAVAGGFDDATSTWTMAKLDSLGVLSSRNELGAAAFRPYDRDRSGAVIGEGSAFVVLEDLQHCLRRGGRVYAEVTGFGSGFDADALFTPEPSGRSLAAALGAAMSEARLHPDDVDYVATHGCATSLGDPAEAAALTAALSPAGRPVAASTVKPATGHLVAAAGALNVVVAALAVHHGAAPATLNLGDPDPNCSSPAVDWITGPARDLPVTHALALAQGLEGQSVALAVSQSPTRGE